MRVLVSGSSGFIGSALTAKLTTDGHSVVRLVRSRGTGATTSRVDPRGVASVPWDPTSGVLNPSDLEGIDAVVHLAGESLAGGIWTAGRRRRIYGSRVDGTDLLCRRLAQLRRPPPVLLSASAVGFYGSKGEEVLTEESPAGEGFLADLCRAWEDATVEARQAGIRVVSLRTGLILDRSGGMLARLLPLFRAGLGAMLGDGRQYMSWISLKDHLGMISLALESEELVGPLNLVGPEPVTNREFTMRLANQLRRPALLRIPAGLVRLLPGRMAEEMILASQRVVPKRAVELGFAFADETLDDHLRAMLGSSPGE